MIRLAKWHDQWGKMVSTSDEDTLAFEMLETLMDAVKESASMRLKQTPSLTDFKNLKKAVHLARDLSEKYYEGKP